MKRQKSLLKTVGIGLSAILLLLPGLQTQPAAAGINTEPGLTVSEPIRLKYASFNPVDGEPNVPQSLTARFDNTVKLVRMTGPLSSADIISFENAGALILGYVPEYTYLAHIPAGSLTGVRDLGFVSWLGDYHPAYKIEPGLMANGAAETEINVVYFARLPARGGIPTEELLENRIQASGGKILNSDAFYPVKRVRLAPSRISELAALPEVRWIDRYSPPVKDMNYVRGATGADMAGLDGFDGSGIVGEVKDAGIDQSHVDFSNLTGTYGNPGVDPHGTSTFGIVFADGANNQTATGMMPEGTGVFCDWSVSRNGSISNLKNSWGGVFQSNSWHAGGTNGDYNSFSQQNDSAMVTHDVLMLYAAGNSGISAETISTDAAAKNVICVGAVFHGNTESKSDDRWRNYGSGNTPGQGPAADGRIKPDLCGFFDWIFTTDNMGGSGYSAGNYTTNFGGTSGATPIVAGAAGLTYQMFKENHFGNNGSGTLPRAATVKALLIANAYQYDFSAANRYRQGWGLADVGRVHQAGSNQLIVDGGNPLSTGDSWQADVQRYSAGEPLKISLVWNDKAGEATSSKALINDLDLQVTAPDGTVYRGNVGLVSNLYSTADGSFDRLNNVENIFIEAPLSGTYQIKITAHNIALDNDGADGVNQDFSLVASMVETGVSGSAIITGPGPGPANQPLIRVYNASSTGTPLAEWTAYGVDMYGANVATGDLDGDGIDSIITGPGPGAVFGPNVRAFDAQGNPLPGVSFLAYGTKKYGVNVIAADIDGDGMDEIITGAGPGKVFGPHVRGWNVDGTAPQAIPAVSFLAYGTDKYGVNVAAGDIDGDGSAEIVTGAGPGAVFGPHVRAWNYDGGTLSPIGAVNFFAYGTPRWGVNVATGDIDGDGMDEIITGAGPGAVFSPHVRAWNYDGTNLTPVSSVNFFAYNGARFGAVVSAADVDNDGMDEILTMPGPDPAKGARARAWNVDGGSVTPISGIDFQAYEGMDYTHGGTIAGGSF